MLAIKQAIETEWYQESHHSFVSFYYFWRFFLNKNKKNEIQIFFYFCCGGGKNKIKTDERVVLLCRSIGMTNGGPWRRVRLSVRFVRLLAHTQHGPFDILSIRFTLLFFLSFSLFFPFSHMAMMMNPQQRNQSIHPSSSSFKE